MSTLEEKRNLALEELIQYTRGKTTKKESEFTAREFAKLIGKSEYSTKGILKNLETEGKVTSRIIVFNGTTTRVYEPVLSNNQ